MSSNLMNIAIIASKNRFAHLAAMTHSLFDSEQMVNLHILVLDDLNSTDQKKLNVKLESDFLNSVQFYFPEEVTPPDLWEKIYLRQSPLEIACIFKSLFCRFLFSKESLDSIVYCDTDLYFLGRPQGFLDALSNSSALFLPHRVVPRLDIGISELFQESQLMTTGVFNLGFFGLRKTPSTLSFLDWWANRMVLVCSRNSAAGLFDDQGWIDAAVALFDGFKSFNDIGYNVANWNLAERSLSKSRNHYLVNEQPLVFFHFSGFDHHQTTFLCQYTDMIIPEHSALECLCREYQEKLEVSERVFPIDRPFSKTIEV